jgi:hypothetical protein
MLPLTRNSLIRFTPPELEGTEKPPVYLIGIPSVAGRAELRRAIAAAGMRYWPESDFSKEARKYLEEVRPDNLADLLAVVDGLEAVKLPEPLPEGETESEAAAAERERLEAEAMAAREKWNELLELLSQQCPRLGKMTGDNVHYSMLSPYISVAMFLRGWENVEPQFKRLSDGTVPHELLEELPPGHVGQIWRRINELMQPNRAQEKNFKSPSQSAGSPMSFERNDSPAAVNGKSAETTTA